MHTVSCVRRAFRFRARIALVSAASIAFSAGAQVSPSSTSSTADSEDEAVSLSPFLVTAEEDAGYAAKSTLAGTRIRTELKDVGSSVSVITRQFLEDTASNSIEELLVYTTNTEVSAEGGNLLGKGDGPILTDPPATSTRQRRPDSGRRATRRRSRGLSDSGAANVYDHQHIRLLIGRRFLRAERARHRGGDQHGADRCDARGLFRALCFAEKHR